MYGFFSEFPEQYQVEIVSSVWHYMNKNHKIVWNKDQATKIIKSVPTLESIDVTSLKDRLNDRQIRALLSQLEV